MPLRWEEVADCDPADFNVMTAPPMPFVPAEHHGRPVLMAALVAGGRARDLKEGVALAAQSIDSGAARNKLDDLIGFSQALAGEA